MRIQVLTLFACSIFCTSAFAQTATLDCGSGAQPMVVRYSDEDAPRNPPKTMFVDFWRLVKHERCRASGPCMVTAQSTKRLACKRGAETYEFVFKPLPFNANLQGQCGARMTGEVTVSKNGKVVLPTTEFEEISACYSAKEEPPAIASIAVSATGAPPVVTRAKER